MEKLATFFPVRVDILQKKIKLYEQTLKSIAEFDRDMTHLCPAVAKSTLKEAQEYDRPIQEVKSRS